MPHIDTLEWNKHTHIGLDLDETLADSVMTGIEELHRRGKMLQIREKSQIIDYHCSRLDGADMSDAELDMFWRGHLLGESPIISGAHEGVTLLSRLEKSLSIVTARHDHLHREDAENWLTRHFPMIPLSELIFVNHSRESYIPKSVICNQKNITLLIDDGYHNIVDALRDGITCILLEKPWNRHEILEHPLLYRAKNWDEIIQSLTPYVH